MPEKKKKRAETLSVVAQLLGSLAALPYRPGLISGDTCPTTVGAPDQLPSFGAGLSPGRARGDELVQTTRSLLFTLGGPLGRLRTKEASRRLV